MDKRQYYQEPSVAASYERRRVEGPAGLLTHHSELAALHAAFKSSEKIVELACGTGRLLRSLRQEGWNVTGVDQSPAMLEAGELQLGKEAVVGDVFNLPLEDQSVDGAYCFRFTNHYPDLSGFFTECSRVLKPGGHFLFDVMRWSPLSWVPFYPGGKNFTCHESQIRLWLDRAGLTVKSIEPLFPVGPYLIAWLPSRLAHGVLNLRGRVPTRWCAITLWHVYRSA